MAVRPVFVPLKDKVGVEIRDIEFQWFAGFAPSQKQKSIKSLHDAVREQGMGKLLEISSKRGEFGSLFSAFNLKFSRDEEGGKTYFIENIFQGSKVFEKGGPYTDLYSKTAREAKKDERLGSSGQITGFKCFDEEFPLQPITYFYDYIYINALMQNRDLSDQLLEFDGFTDIEFNPKKSLNCQAYSAALYVSLAEKKLLDDVRNDKDAFLKNLEAEYKRRNVQALPIGGTKKLQSKIKSNKIPKKRARREKASPPGLL